MKAQDVNNAARKLINSKWVPMGTLHQVPFERRIVFARYGTLNRQTVILEVARLFHSEMDERSRQDPDVSISIMEARILVGAILHQCFRTIVRRLTLRRRVQ